MPSTIYKKKNIISCDALRQEIKKIFTSGSLGLLMNHPIYGRVWPNNFLKYLLIDLLRTILSEGGHDFLKCQYENHNFISLENFSLRVSGYTI